MPGPHVLCYLLWHCPLPCTARCAKPDPDPDSPVRCGLAGCRLQSGAPCVSQAIRIQIARPIRRAGPRPEGMRALPQAPPAGQPPNTWAVLPHLAAAPPEPGNRNQNQGPSRLRAGTSLVVNILQAASATAVDVNRAPRPAGAGGASGRGAPQSTTGPSPGPRAPSRLWDLAQCAAQIGFEAETAAFAEGNNNLIIVIILFNSDVVLVFLEKQTFCTKSARTLIDCAQLTQGLSFICYSPPL